MDTEDLAHPPSGGGTKLALLGILLPLALAAYATRGLVMREIYMPGRGGSGTMLHGDSAVALSLACLCLAALAHIRWCWGLLGWVRVFEAGTVLFGLGFAAALLWAFLIA